MALWLRGKSTVDKNSSLAKHGFCCQRTERTASPSSCSEHLLTLVLFNSVFGSLGRKAILVSPNKEFSDII